MLLPVPPTETSVAVMLSIVMLFALARLPLELKLPLLNPPTAGTIPGKVVAMTFGSGSGDRNLLNRLHLKRFLHLSALSIENARNIGNNDLFGYLADVELQVDRRDLGATHIRRGYKFRKPCASTEIL